MKVRVQNFGHTDFYEEELTANLINRLEEIADAYNGVVQIWVNSNDKQIYIGAINGD